MAGDNLGASFSIDVTDLKAGLAEANRLIRESESQFREAAAGMDDWSNSQEGLETRIGSLNDQIGIQEKKVSALVAQKQQIIAKMKAEGKSNEEISRAVDGVNKQIERESKQLDKLKGDLKKSEKALGDLADSSDDAADSTKDAADAADEAGSSFEGLKGAAGVAAGAFAAIGAAAGAAIGAFLGLAESTRESRTAMGKLETAFANVGLSAQDAESTFTSLYGVLGDEGRATESAAFLAQYADNEAELAEQTRILTGVFATYGDSIPTEGLAEGIAATISMGETQGVLADALEWQGVNLEDFNKKLGNLKTEQEREALITETLNGLYGDAADAYTEMNAEIIASQEAQAGLTQAMNDLGAIAEPIMTTLKTLATDLLVAITPFVELIGEGLAGALNGSAGAADTLAQGLGGIFDTLIDTAAGMLPMVIELVISLVPKIISTLLDQIPELLGFILDAIPMVLDTLSTVLPQIIAKIVELVPMLVEQLIASIPQILQASITLLMSIVQALPTIITNLIAALPSVVNTIISTLLASIPILIDAAIQLLMAIVDAIPEIINALGEALPTIINAIIDGLLSALPLLLNGAIELLMAIVEAIPTIISALYKDVPNIVRTVISTLLSRLPDLINGAIQLFMGIISAIPTIITELGKQVPTIISAIVESLTDGISDIKTVGGNLLKGLWNGINDKVAWLKRQVKGVVDKIKGWFTGKDGFDESSPSKWSRGVAEYVMDGLGIGFRNGMSGLYSDVDNIVTGVKARLGGGIDATINGNGVAGLASGLNGGVVINQTNNYSQAHSRFEIYRSKQQTVSAVKLALAGGARA